MILEFQTELWIDLFNKFKCQELMVAWHASLDIHTVYVVSN